MQSEAVDALVKTFATHAVQPFAPFPSSRLSRSFMSDSPSKSKPGDWLCRWVARFFKLWPDSGSIPENPFGDVEI